MRLPPDQMLCVASASPDQPVQVQGSFYPKSEHCKREQEAVKDMSETQQIPSNTRHHQPVKQYEMEKFQQPQSTKVAVHHSQTRIIDQARILGYCSQTAWHHIAKNGGNGSPLCITLPAEDFHRVVHTKIRTRGLAMPQESEAIWRLPRGHPGQSAFVCDVSWPSETWLCPLAYPVWSC